MSEFLDAEELEEELDQLDLYEPEPEIASGLDRNEPDPRLGIAVKVLSQVNESICHVIELLEGGETDEAAFQLAGLVTSKKNLEKNIADLSGSRVIEGVFNGEGMVGSDGKVYSVPPNYASKSRLVEGDILKLTIKNDGTFIYKQIGPIERRRVNLFQNISIFRTNTSNHGGANVT